MTSKVRGTQSDRRTRSIPLVKTSFRRQREGRRGEVTVSGESSDRLARLAPGWA